MKRIQHLKYRIFAMLFNGHSRTKRPAVRRCIENDCNDLTPMRTLIKRVVDLSHHGDIKDIDWRTRESQPCDAIVYIEFDVLIGFGH
jgi:hypothetical protein